MKLEKLLNDISTKEGPPLPFICDDGSYHLLVLNETFNSKDEIIKEYPNRKYLLVDSAEELENKNVPDFLKPSFDG